MGIELPDLNTRIAKELPAVQGNTSFSRAVPNLQLAVDSTSLGQFKTCPRKYQLNILCGLQGRDGNVHLEFGSWVHQAREGYEHSMVAGLSHDDAVDRAVEKALKASWDSKLGRPWISGHADKHRVSLLRTIVWYLDQMAKDDPLKTVVLASGKPAVELSFRFESGYQSHVSGESILFCGHLDRLAKLGINSYVPDIKTTGWIGPSFFQGFTPGNQFSMYTLAARVCFAESPDAVMVDGIEVKSEASKFQRQIVPRPAGVVEEWHRGTGYWLRQMEACAVAGEWPMNDTACSMYGGCEFRSICARSPASRGIWLKQGFRFRIWDPLVVREG